MKKSNSQATQPAAVTTKAVQTTGAAFTLIELVVVISVIALLALMLSPALARSRVTDHSFQCQNNLRQLMNAWRMYAADNSDKVANAFDWMGGYLDYNGSSDNTNVLRIKQSLLWPYVNNLPAFKCPADLSRSYGKTGDPRVRSISMSQAFSRNPDSTDFWTSPPWRIFMKGSDMINPPPANLWVFIDENPDSVNDAAFAVAMGSVVPPDFAATKWQDGPANYHNGGCGFGLADGHSEIKKWKDPRTLAPPVTATYLYFFAYGLLQTNNSDIRWVQEKTTAKY